MENQINNFIILLTNFLHRDSQLVLEEPVEWDKIMSHARKHNMQGIVFEMAVQYMDFKKLKKYDSYFWETARIIAGQVFRTREFLELYSKFAENNIFPIVLKGIVCRKLYGEFRDRRPSGDEDILICKEEFEKTKQILEANNYKMAECELTKEKINTIQEVSFYNKQTGSHIEVHLNVMGTNNLLNKKMSNCFRNVFDTYILMEEQGVEFRTLNHTDHVLYLIMHAFKHFIYTGFGIRQVIDILLYIEKYGDCCDWDYIKKTVTEIHAEYFVSDLIHIGNKYLGFSLKMWKEEKCTEALFEDIISNGIFGEKSPAKSMSALVISSAVDDFEKKKKSSTFKWILRSIFPGKEWLAVNVPEARKKPWGILGAYFKRWKKAFTFFYGERVSLVGESMRISGKRVALIRKYEII